MAPRKRSQERTIDQARVDTEAAELRAQRLTYPQIAAKQGCSVSTAYQRVRRAIASVPYEAVEELRRVELESLDELEQRVREVLVRAHVKIDHGRVIRDEDTGAPMLDDAPVLAAAQQLLRIKDMRAKLTGAYAPTKSAVTVITEDAVDAAIRDLESELASRDRGTTGEAAAAGRAATGGGGAGGI
jgi:hypothetical protein